MKKTYITPNASCVQLAAEQILCTSGVSIHKNDYADGDFEELSSESEDWEDWE